MKCESDQTADRLFGRAKINYVVVKGDVGKSKGVIESLFPCRQSAVEALQSVTAMVTCIDNGRLLNAINHFQESQLIKHSETRKIKNERKNFSRSKAGLASKTRVFFSWSSSSPRFS